MKLVKQSVLHNNVSIKRFDEIVLFFYSLYFVLNPFYFFKSGLPQIADFVMLFSLFLFVIKSRMQIIIKIKNKRILILGTTFILWIFLVNTIWSFILQQAIFVPTVFYFYNCLIFIYTLMLYDKYCDVLLKMVYTATLTSLIIQLFIYFAQGGFTGGRQTISFNNPNQLGYYSLLMISFLMLISSRISVKVKSLLMGITIALVFVFSSLSKAAIVSLVALVGFYILGSDLGKNLKKKIIVTTLILFVTTGLIYSSTNIIQENQLYNSVKKRIESIGNDGDDNLEGRGYYRLYEYPEYWMFGAGEGGYSRFRNETMEFHSTLGNIQVSYGVVGLILFILFVHNVLIRGRYSSAYIIVSLLAYGFTHNGIRNTLLWILMALMANAIKSIDCH